MALIVTDDIKAQVEAFLGDASLELQDKWFDIGLDYDFLAETVEWDIVQIDEDGSLLMRGTLTYGIEGEWTQTIPTVVAAQLDMTMSKVLAVTLYAATPAGNEQ